MKKLFLFLFLLLVSSSVFAEDRGNGGGVIIYDDDNIVLADQFYWEDNRIHFPDLLIKELKIIGNTLVNAYARKSSYEQIRYNGLESSAFIEELILAPGNVFKPVKKIPKECHNQRPSNIPRNSRYLDVGCTYLSGETLLVKEVFEKMSIREQAKLLVHERLYLLPTRPNLKEITEITNGLEIVLSHLQKEYKGQYENLSNANVAKLNKFRTQVIVHLSIDPQKLLKFNEKFLTTTRGGGKVSLESTISADSYIGIQSTVGRNSVIEKSVLIDSAINNLNVEDSYLAFSKIFLLNSLDQNTIYSSVVKNSYLDIYSTNMVNASLINSKFSEYDGWNSMVHSKGNMKLLLNRGAAVLDSIIKNRIPRRCDYGVMNSTSFIVGENTSIKGMNETFYSKCKSQPVFEFSIDEDFNFDKASVCKANQFILGIERMNLISRKNELRKHCGFL